MKPSDAVIQKLSSISPIISGNVESIVEDWLKDWSACTNGEDDQEVHDCLFSIYVAGMLNAMNHGSAFNQKYSLINKD